MMTETERAEKLAGSLKMAAEKSLLLDLDWLKLVDTSKLTLQADGTVKGADELMTELKEAKPFLFGKRVSEMTPQEASAKLAELKRGPPPVPAPTTKRASEMSEQERVAYGRLGVAGHGLARQGKARLGAAWQGL